MKPLIQIKDLTKKYAVGKRTLTAVQPLSFDIGSGETVGLVGESGCGKSTLGKMLLRLIEPSAGSICFDGIDLCGLNPKELRNIRKQMHMIFQDPYASLNPRMTVRDIIAEPLEIHRIATGKARDERVLELLKLVGLESSHLHRFPHEFSGGQRQRIGIARALAVEPQFVVCDEPLSALDSTTHRQVLDLLVDLQKQKGLTYLFISHDLRAVNSISNRVIVMYLGQIVEMSSSRALFDSPYHPYTQALVHATPVPDPVRERKRSRIILTGDVPSPFQPPSGCAFHPRCPFAKPICKTMPPLLQEVQPGRFAACHFPLMD